MLRRVNNQLTQLEREGTSPQTLRLWAIVFFVVAATGVLYIAAVHAWNKPFEWLTPLFFVLIALHLWRLSRKCAEPHPPSILKE
jgi:hypothetical protein